MFMCCKHLYIHVQRVKLDFCWKNVKGDVVKINDKPLNDIVWSQNDETQNWK